MGKIIGFINQKGGVGKSTLAMQFATSLFVNQNPEKKQNFLCAVDTDRPQHTILKTREKETQFLMKFRNEGDYYFDKKLDQIYNEDFKPYHIYTDTVDEFIKASKALKEKYDYTIVDFVGTVNTDNFNDDKVIDFMEIFDFIIVPTPLKFEELRTSYIFARNLLKPLYDNEIIKGYACLFNMVSHHQRNDLESAQENMRNKEINFFENFLNGKEKNSRMKVIHRRDGQVSTLFPSKENKYFNLTSELLEKLSENEK